MGQGKSDPYATLEIRADGETHNFKTEVSLDNFDFLTKFIRQSLTRAVLKKAIFPRAVFIKVLNLT